MTRLEPDHNAGTLPNLDVLAVQNLFRAGGFWSKVLIGLPGSKAFHGKVAGNQKD
jgi:hypothetical protein